MFSNTQTIELAKSEIKAVLKRYRLSWTEVAPGAAVQPQLNSKTRKMLAGELREIKAGKNISPHFKNVKDAISFLKNL